MICLVTDSTRLPVDTFIVRSIKIDTKKYSFNISIFEIWNVNRIFGNCIIQAVVRIWDLDKILINK